MQGEIEIGGPGTSDTEQQDEVRAPSVAVERRSERPAIETEQERDKVADVLMRAVDKGIDVDSLERLVTLKERVDARAAHKEFVDALARFQEECPPIPKARKVDFVSNNGNRIKYDFAPLGVIRSITRDPLSRNGLSYTYKTKFSPGEVAVRCILRHIGGHSEYADFVCSTVSSGSPTMNDAQKAGSAISYGQRYSFLLVTGLATDNDDDAESLSGEHAETISDEQLANVSELLSEADMDDKSETRFYSYFRVEKLSQLPLASYAEAVSMLRRKIVKRKRMQERGR